MIRRLFHIAFVLAWASVAPAAENLLGVWDNSGSWGIEADGNVYAFDAVADTNNFRMTWAIPNTDPVTLPTINGSTYNCTIDWGDGSAVSTVTAWDDADLAHAYPSAANYQIEIVGTFERIYFNNNAAVDQLPICVDNLGNVGWTSFGDAFEGCSNLTNVQGACQVSGVTGWLRAFQNCSSLIAVECATNFATANVTTFASMFRSCGALAAIDVSSWDTSAATTFSQFFMNCAALSTLDVSSWDVSHVSDFGSAFYVCSSLTTLDVSGWDTSAGASYNWTFYYCLALPTIDVSGWVVTNASNFAEMFYDCRAVTVLDLSAWVNSKATTYADMFKNCWLVKELDFTGLDTANATLFSSTWNGCRDLITIDLSGQDFSAVTTFNHAFHQCFDLTNAPMISIPASCVDATDIYEDCYVATGDVATVGNASVQLAGYGFEYTLLSYSKTNATLSTNVMHGFNLDAYQVSLAESEVDYILIDLDDSAATNGLCNVGGNNSAPSATGATAATNLVNRSWTLTLN